MVEQTFILWGLSRSGTTALFRALVALTDYPFGLNEPLVERRSHGFLTRRYRADGDGAAADAGLARMCASRPAIKHNIDTVPVGMTRALFAVTRAQGYRHLFLHRARHADRLASWLASLVTENFNDDPALAPAPEVLEARARLDAPRLAVRAIGHVALYNELYDALAAAGEPVLSVGFEALFDGPPELCRATLSAICAHLRLPEDRLDLHALRDPGNRGRRGERRAALAQVKGYDRLGELLARAPAYRVGGVNLDRGG